jgi:carbon storage regulator
MLVLSRKPGESVVVPQCDVMVKIIAIKGKTVRLGISAPAEVAVLREELVQRKKHEGMAGADSLNRADRD